MNEVLDGVVRLPEVVRVTGYSRSSIYALERAGKFPPRRQLGGGRAVGWLRSDLARWLESRPPAGSERVA